MFALCLCGCILAITIGSIHHITPIDTILPSSPKFSVLIGDESACFNPQMWQEWNVLVTSSLEVVVSIGLSAAIGYRLKLAVLFEQLCEYKYNAGVVFLSIFMVPCAWWVCMLPLSCYSTSLANNPMAFSPQDGAQIREHQSALQAFIDGSLALATQPISISISAAFCFIIQGDSAVHVAVVVSSLANLARIVLSLTWSGLAGNRAEKLSSLTGFSQTMIFPMTTFVCSPTTQSHVTSLVLLHLLPGAVAALWRAYVEQTSRKYGPVVVSLKNYDIAANNEISLRQLIIRTKMLFFGKDNSALAIGLLFFFHIFVNCLDCNLQQIAKLPTGPVIAAVVLLLFCQVCIVLLIYNLLGTHKHSGAFPPGKPMIIA
jgi:hypothetical protein